MPWKVKEDGTIEVQDGNPVWIYEGGAENGKEAAVDFSKTLATIANTTKESIQRKEKIAELKGKLDPIEAAGITDFGDFMAKAKQAMDTVANLNDKEILDAGQVDKIKSAITEGYEKKIEAIKNDFGKKIAEGEGKLSAKDASIKRLLIKGAFDGSEFLREKTFLLPEIAYTFFGERFDVEEVNGNFMGFAKGKDGEKLMSIKNPGDIAGLDEAIELIIADYPQKDRILKADQSGSGLPGSKSTGGHDGNLVTKYSEAKAKGDVTTMVSLKGQMQEKGIPIPL